ncbi:MAG: hypothetical protein AMJ79_10065 [Phycisphaerae bacterium SM23_30]|nr:MAG: hypothetical protein AMJ79_10065 [Phycisphaerae bacterium SM23_30]
MRHRILITVLSVILCSCIAGGNGSYSGPAADMVIKNAKIVTIDKDHPRAEAIAIAGEFILAVGSNDQIEPYIQEGNRKGMLKKGYLADMVIFNEDLMTIPHDQIMKVKVDYTIVGGKIVYKREVTH